MAIGEDLENGVRELTSGGDRENLITRRLYDQALRNGDQIGALRSEIATARVDIQALTSQTDHIVGEVVQSTAALRSQGARLDTLTRDIGLLRKDKRNCTRGSTGTKNESRHCALSLPTSTASWMCLSPRFHMAARPIINGARGGAKQCCRLCNRGRTSSNRPSIRPCRIRE